MSKPFPLVYIKRSLASSACHRVLDAKIRWKQNIVNALFLIKETSIQVKIWDGHLRSVLEQPFFGSVKSASIIRLPNSTEGDVLACTSDSGNLSLLQFTQNGFVSRFQYPIAFPGYDLDQLGCKLAVDSLNRAVATCAGRDQLSLWLFDPSSTSPLYKQQQLIHHGVILELCFLEPDPGFPHLLRLAVLSSQHASFHVTVYVWNVETILSSIESVQPFAYPLVLGQTTSSSSVFAFDEDEMDQAGPNNDVIPLDMISLSHPGSFCIVTETDVLVYRGTAGDTPRFNLYSHAKIPTFSRSSSDIPLLSCMMVMNHIRPVPNQVGLLLAFDSKHFAYVTISFVSRPGHALVEIDSLGKRCHTSSMGLLTVNDRQVLYLAGDMSDGELVVMEWGATTPVFHRKATLSNGAPIIDVKRIPSIRGMILPDSGQDVMIAACNGPGETGSIREIRHGVVERIISASETDDATDQAPICTGLWSLRSHNVDRYLVATFANETRVMGVVDAEGGQTLDDLTDELHVDSQTCTLAAQLVEQGILQVHDGGISIGNRLLWSGNVSLAAMDGQDIVLMTNQLVYLRHVNGSLKECGTLQVDGRVSTISLFKSNNSTLLILGGFQTALQVFYLKPSGELFFLDGWQQGQQDLIPNSIVMIGKDRPHFIVGMRNGTCIVFEWKNDKLNLVLVQTLGRGPVTVSSNANQSFAVAQCEFLWKIQLDETGPRIFPLASDRQVDRAIPFATLDSQDVISFGQGHWTMSQLEMDPRVVIGKPISLPSAPRRLLYWRDPVDRDVLLRMDKYVVVVGPRGSQPSEIRVMDAATHRLLVTQSLALGEVCNCLVEWRRRERRLLCVGTEYLDDGEKRGRALFFTIHNGPQNSSVLKQRDRLLYNGPVEAMASCKDQLIVGVGNELSFVVADVDDLLVNVGLRSLRHEVQSIAIRDFVYVSTFKDSIEAFELQSDKLRFIASDPVHRLTSGVLPMDDIVYGIDKNSHIFGLSQHHILGNSMGEVFSYCVGEYCTRIIAATLGLRETNSSDFVYTTNDEFVIHDPGADVVGVTTIGGGLYSIISLSSKQHDILLSLQKALAIHPLTKPLLGNVHEQFRYESRHRRHPRALDGDMISGFLRLSNLEQMNILQSCQLDIGLKDLCRLIETLNLKCVERVSKGLFIHMKSSAS